MVCGITTKHSSEPLLEGSAFHEGKAEWYRSRSRKKALVRAKEYLKLVRKDFFDDALYTKALGRVTTMLSTWIDKFGELDLKNYKILLVEEEIRAKLPGTNYIVSGRLDLVVEDELGRVLIFDTKTSGFSLQSTMTSFRLSDQPVLYKFLFENRYKRLVHSVVCDISYWNRRSNDTDNIDHSRPEVVKPTQSQVEFLLRGLAQSTSEISQLVNTYRKTKDASIFQRNDYYCNSFNRPCEFAEVCRSHITPRTKPPLGLTRSKEKLTLRDVHKDVFDVMAEE